MVSSIAFAVVTSIKWYDCGKYGTTIKSSTYPQSGSCPKGSSHNWTGLGEVGNKNYSCSKCGITIQTNSFPQMGTCPKGSTHSWSSL